MCRLLYLHLNRPEYTTFDHLDMIGKTEHPKLTGVRHLRELELSKLSSTGTTLGGVSAYRQWING